MKVLLDCSHLNTGGSIQVGLAVLRNAARTAEHQWTAVLSSRVASQVPPEIDRAFAGTVRFAAPRGGPVGRYLQIATHLPRIEAAFRPDVVFTVFGPAKWRARAPHLVGFAIPHLLYPDAAVFAQRRSLADRLDATKLALQVAWGKRAVRSADYLVVETETVRRRAAAELRVRSDRIFVVRNTYSGYFADALGPAPVGAPSPEGWFRVFVPSAYYPHKNLEVVSAVARALVSLTERPFEIVLTLPADEPPWRRIAGRSAALGVADRVRTAGPIPHRELGNWYRGSGAVFLPTLLECSSAVYPESFAAGVPLVTSDLDFARELCRDAALFVDPRDPAAAARALAALMGDGALRDRLVRAGCDVLASGYPSPERKWDEQLACLREVVARGKPGRGGR